MLAKLRKLFSSPTRVARHGPITQELVSECVARIEGPLAEKLGEVVARCAADDRVRRLELIIRPELAASRVPISFYAYAAGRVAIDDVEWRREDLLPDHGSLLPATYADVPIGRHDIAGLDFTPEWTCIEATLAAKVREIWGEIGKRCPSRLDVLVGTMSFGDGPNDPDSFWLLNLKSGLREDLEVSHAD